MRPLKTFATTFIISGIVFTAGLPHAFSADVNTPQPEKTNSVFYISPYLWMTGLTGDVSPFKHAPTVAVDQSFNDVLKDLNFAGFIDFYYRRDNWVLSGDIMYVDTTDKKATGSHIINLAPYYPVKINLDSASIKVDSKIFNSTLTAGYRVVDQDAFKLDLLGGVRIWNISNEVTIKAAGNIGGPTINESYRLKKSFSWVDPVIAARGWIHATDRISFLINADIGGFDVGSKLSWQAMATLNYRFNDNWIGSVGYKHLSVNYNHNGHVFNTRLSGPVIAATYQF